MRGNIFSYYLGNTWMLVLLNIPRMARNQPSSVIVCLTSVSFTRYKKGSTRKYMSIIIADRNETPTCSWANNFGPPIITIEVTNSTNHTMNVILMLTSLSLRLLALDLSDNNLSRFFSELRSLKNYIVY